MERVDRLYPFITGLVAGAFILASLERVFRVEAVKPLPPGAAHCARLPAGGAATAAVAPWPPGALAGDVLHSPQHLGHGHVRLRLPVVFDGCAGARNLARLPPRHRPLSQSAPKLTRLESTS